MARVEIRHKPGLTTEEAMRIFVRGFGTRYEVYRRKTATRYFIIKKSAWTCANVRLFQKKDKTYFNVVEDVPSTGLRFLVIIMFFIPALWPVLLVWLVLSKRAAKPLIDEVRRFIAAAPEFR